MNYQDLFSNREFTNAKKELCDVEDPGQLSDLYHSRFNCADSFFNIGQDHLKSASPCQDYTISDRFGVLPYGIVSDGCSSSGKTDLGSRFVVLSTQKIIHEGFCPFFLKDIDNLRDSLVEKLYRIKREYRLTDFDLDATLGLVMSVPRFETFMKKEIYVAKAYMFGDGVLSYQCDDTLTILSLHWAGNMPGYPSYYLDRSRRDIFVKIVEENAKLENIAPCFIKKTILKKNT